MNLDSALTSAVSGLQAQGSAISDISQNISNSDTTAYKISETDFESLVTGSGNDESGVVTTNSTTAMESQGSVYSTDVSTNLALQGGGFFVVTNDTNNPPSADQFTRDGSFAANNDGYLVNDEGEYLLGWPTNSSGDIIANNTNDQASLSPVDVNTLKGAAKATSTVSISANLPADATTGQTFTDSTEIYDSLGVSSTLDMTWTKTGTDTWSLSIANPVLTSDTSTTSGTITAPASPAVYDITFNGDGTIASATDATTGSNLTNLALDIGSWTTGASDSTISLNLGTANEGDGLTQFTSNTTDSSVPQVTISSIKDDGLAFGALSSISISSTGLVTAKFDNGLSEPVFQVAVGTFADPDGLTLVNGTVYEANAAAGNVVLNQPGTGSAGKITASSLEGSDTDTSTEISKMIEAEQAYSASSKLITAVSTMFQDLVQAIQ